MALFLGLIGAAVALSEQNAIDRQTALDVLDDQTGQPGRIGESLQDMSLTPKNIISVRAPFGGNPQYEKLVNDPSVLMTEEYQRDYQKNIWDVRVATAHPLLPETNIFSDRNLYSGYNVTQPDYFSNNNQRFKKT